jgi:hypothetical protein
MNVYPVSWLDTQLVKDLFMIPLSGPEKVARLIVGNESCAVIAGAQHAAVRHVGEGE